MSDVLASIKWVGAREILDSRGSPTVEATVTLSDGRAVQASVPAGRSKSRYEAVELRDGEPGRYEGLGVRGAVSNVNTIIGPALVGRSPCDQAGLDALLIGLDSTQNKERLGANATLAVSVALARAGALVRDMPLWQYLESDCRATLPLPMVNIISGGLHARNGFDFQDFLILPVSATSFSEALEICGRVHTATRLILGESGHSLLKADEGGFAPSLSSNAAALDLLVAAVGRAGYEPATDVAFGIDVAASHLLDNATGLYLLQQDRRECNPAEMVDTLASLTTKYPIVSIEDGLAEDDWEGWRALTARLGADTQIVGDDFFATNPERLRRGIEAQAANAILVKMNQIGTLTETFAVVSEANQGNFRTIVSARSGETEDSALADIAVATGAGQIKIGSLAQSDRLAKYNQLLRIEEALGSRAIFAGWQGGRRGEKLNA